MLPIIRYLFEKLNRGEKNEPLYASMPKVLEDARYITKKPVGKKPEVRIQALDDAEDEDPDPYDGFSSWQSMELMEVMERTEDWIQDLKHRIALNSLPKR